MTKIVAVGAIRGGTGKSNIIANLAMLLADRGKRVGVVEADFHAPSMSVLFGLSGESIGCTLNDYLSSTCSIEETAYDVSQHLNLEPDTPVYIVPSTIRFGDTGQLVRESYDTGRIQKGLRDFADHFGLDVVLIDMRPGIEEPTTLLLGLCDVFLATMRPDTQYFQGTGVMVELARKLDVPHILLVVNEVSGSYNHNQVKEDVARIYGCDVFTLPYSQEMQLLGSANIFVLRHPDHAMTQQFKHIAAWLDEA